MIVVSFLPGATGELLAFRHRHLVYRRSIAYQEVPTSVLEDTLMTEYLPKYLVRKVAPTDCTFLTKGQGEINAKYPKYRELGGRELSV